MSDSSPDVAEFTAQATQIEMACRVVISGAALVFYDYAVTFSTEVSEIWKAKFNGAQALFFMTRYSYMVYTVLLCAEVFTQNPSEMLCQAIEFNAKPFVIMAQIGLYGILTLRTYAIYQKNRFILVILGLTSVASVIVAVSLQVLEKPAINISVLGANCGVFDQSVTPRIQLVEQVLALTLDVLVFGFTFAKTIGHTIEMRKVRLVNSLGYFFLRDGAMYFLAKLLIGVVGITVFFIRHTGAIGNWIGVIGAIGNPLSIVLINRLVLNLRQASRSQEEKVPTLGAIGTILEPAFATNSILGNLGAPLRVGPTEDEEIEEIGVEDETEVDEKRGIVDHSGIIEELRDHADV